MAFVEMELFNFDNAIKEYMKDNHQPHHFNCKRCGATGQVDICEYCGSADDKENTNERLVRVWTVIWHPSNIDKRTLVFGYYNDNLWLGEKDVWKGGEEMSAGEYTRDFYIIPTILFHNGDGIYYSLEIAWLKWYIGICWLGKGDDWNEAL